MARRLLEIQPGSFEVSRIQGNVSDVLFKLTQHPMTEAILAQDVLLTAGVVNLIPHGLGRAADGYLIVRNKDAFQLAYEYGTPATLSIDLTKFLPVVSLTTSSVDMVIW